MRHAACARWMQGGALAVLGLCGRASAQEGGEAAAPGGSGGMMSPLFFMIILFGVMWLFLILPNQRREKERKAMLSALGKGDKVVTNGGIIGTIVGINDKTVVLKVSEDPVTKMEFLRAAVTQVSLKSGEKEDDEND
jgi:preprotein translocase subunit YajC